MKRSFVFILLLHVSAISAQITSYPERIYGDTAHAPFIYGVASGEPGPNSVILWTQLENSYASKNIETVYWQVSEDSLFKNMFASGQTTTDANNDFTVHVKINNLKPNQIYYYRFSSADKRFSEIGKARCLPPQDVQKVKLAVISCSSIWSGYFNAYRSLAMNPDIDFVIHLGDYAYDFVDENELFRMPEPFPPNVSNLNEWRDRHRYYKLDPDFRLAHKEKTWIVLWDNHDMHCFKPGKSEEAKQAFIEHTPCELPDSSNPNRLYRSFFFGNLAKLTMLDMHSFRGNERFPDSTLSVLGLPQDDWLHKELSNTKTKWNLIGNQEMMGDWLSIGAPKFIQRGNGRVFDPSNWSGFPEDRNRWYKTFDSLGLKNVVVLTGDAHMSFIIDNTPTPLNPYFYNDRTGKGAMGVELVTPSISRGNMNEEKIPGILCPAIQSYSKYLNPHHVYVQFTKHGYSTLTVTPEACVARFFYVPILKVSNKVKWGPAYKVLSGTGHWEHKRMKKSEAVLY